MLKKNLLLIILLTSIGQLISVAIYPILSRYLSPDSVAMIGLFDTNLMLIIGWLGFGLSVTATRDIANADNWQPILKNTQRAKFTISLIFSLIGGIGILFTDTRPMLWFALLISPLLALNYDYLLYAIGRPLHASFVSFVRVSMPIIVIFPLMQYKFFNVEIYIFVTLIFYFIASFLVSVNTKSPLFFKPSKLFYKIYISAFSIGIAGLFIGLQRYGFINMLNDKFSNDDFVILLMFMKIFLFLVACKRMLVQIFYTRIREPSVVKKINVFCTFISLLSIAICFSLSVEISSLLFNTKDKVEIVQLMGFGVLAVLSFAASDSLLLLAKQDKEFVICTLLVPTTFLLVIFLLRMDLKLEKLIAIMILFEFLLSLSYWLVLKFYKVKELKFC